MAEAVAAIGLAASITTFVGVGVRVLARLREYRSTTQEIPKVLRDVTTQLPLMIDIMERIESGCADGSLPTGTQHALSKVVEGCLAQITLLDGLVEEMLPASTDSAWRRRHKAYKSIRKEKDVATIQRTLESYKTTLTLHFSQRSRASITNAAIESAYFEIPPIQVSRFVERVELLEEITTSFANATGGASHPKIIVLLGMGGQGKTQLALEYCRRARTSGEFQAIFWVDASSPNTVARGFETIAKRISSPGLVFDNTESQIAFVKKTMGSWHIPWLMVFDNYDQPDQFDNIKTYLPQGESGAFLFTSRHTDSERLGVAIKVTQMAEEEGLELLLSQSKLERSDSNVVEGKKIIQKLGYLPLAIDQAAAYISARKLPLKLFINHYNERREVVLKHTPPLWEYRKRLGGDKDETLLSVFTTWELSFQQIGKNEDERAQIGHLLTLSAFIDASNVGEHLFKSYLASAAQPPHWMEYFLAGDVWDQYKYQDTLVNVSSLSLLQNIKIGSTGSFFSLHPLVIEWLKLRTDRKSRQHYITEAKMILAGYIDVQDLDTLPFQFKQDIISHVDAWLQNDQEFLWESDESDVASAGDSANAFAFLYDKYGQYKEAEAMYNQALMEKEKVLGPDHTSTLDTVNSLGNLYRKQGRLSEAEVMYNHALTGFEKVLRPNHTSTLGTVNNLSVLYEAQGRLTEAEVMYNRALTGKEKALGCDHTSTLGTVHNLGLLYKAQGRQAEAEVMFNCALTGKEKVLRPNHTSTLNTVHNLGVLYEAQSRLTKAEVMCNCALTGKEKALGPDHTSTLDTVNNLGNLYKAQGRLTEAEVMYNHTLTGYEKALGSNHTSTLRAVRNLGRLYKAQGRLTEAEVMYNRTLTEFEKVLGPDHTSTLDTVHNLGLLYEAQGRLTEAEVMFNCALTGKEKALGPDHTSTLDTVNNLGNLYKAQGRLTEAEVMYNHTLTGYEKALGSNHTSTLRAVRNLGRLYKAQGRLTEAEVMYNRTLTEFEKVLGPDHTSTLDTVHNLGLLYEAQGRLVKAEVMYNCALTGSMKVLGPDHRSTLNTVNNLGVLYEAQGRLTEAEVMYNRALTGFEKVLGPDHTSTLDTVHNLSLLYEAQGRLTEAEVMFNCALTGKEKALGPDHTSTLDTVHSLGILHVTQSRLTEAEVMFNRALTGYEKALGPDHTSTLRAVRNLGLLYKAQGRQAEAEAMFARASAQAKDRLQLPEAALQSLDTSPMTIRPSPLIDGLARKRNHRSSFRKRVFDRLSTLGVS